MDQLELAKRNVAAVSKALGDPPYLVGFQRGLSKAAKRMELDTRDAFAAHCNELERGYLAGAAGDLEDLVAYLDSSSSEAQIQLQEFLADVEIRALAEPSSLLVQRDSSVRS